MAEPGNTDTLFNLEASKGVATAGQTVDRKALGRSRKWPRFENTTLQSAASAADNSGQISSKV